MNPFEADEEDEKEPWPDEPPEFDPDSLGPEPPDPTPTTRESIDATENVPDGLFRAFWASVLFLNVALAAVSIGLMLIYFRGDYETAGPLLLIGLVAGLGTARYYLRAKTGYYAEEGSETMDPETESKNAE